MALLGGLGAKK